MAQIESWLGGLGAWQPLVYVAVCILAAVLLVPGSVTKMAAGALFGLGGGLVWGFLGASLGAVAAFLVARLGRRSWIERRLRSLPRMARFDASVAAHGLPIVLLLRLSPAVPYSVINYALGMSRVRLRDYVLGTPAMLPSVFLYVYAGGVVREVAEVAGGAADRTWWEWAILAIGLAATGVVAWVLARKARAALIAEGAEPDEVVEEIEDAALGADPP